MLFYVLIDSENVFFEDLLFDGSGFNRHKTRNHMDGHTNIKS